MMRCRLELGGPVWALVLAACGGGGAKSHAVVPTSVQRACERASDCTPVYEGELDCCGLIPVCVNTAIRMDAEFAYRQEVTARTPKCDATLCTQPVCPGGELMCLAGVCEFRPGGQASTDGAVAPMVSAAEYGRDCVDVADCVPIYQGPLGCCGLGCPNSAIHPEDLARYTSDVDHRVPTCYPVPPCAPPLPCDQGRVACVNNVCALLTNTPDAGAPD